MRASKDQLRGTDKKAIVLWSEAYAAYLVLVRQHNKKHQDANTPDFIPLVERELTSFKNHWNSKLHPPAVNKFAGLVETNPPKSGEQKNDALMNLYYNRMALVYEERVEHLKAKIPKQIHKFLAAYKFLRGEARFGSHFDMELGHPEVDDDIYGPDLDAAVDDDDAAAPPSIPRNRKPAASSKRPGGRDSARKSRDRDNVLASITKKVSDGVRDIVAGEATKSASPSTKAFREAIVGKMESMNKVSQQMVNNQVMMTASTPERADYFGTLRANLKAAADLEAQELALRRQRMEIERLKAEREIEELRSNATGM